MKELTHKGRSWRGPAITVTAFDYCNNEACGNEIDAPNEMGYCADCLAEMVPV